MLALRKEQHAAKMELMAAKKAKVEWEMAYWRAMYEREFGAQPTVYSSEAAGQPFYMKENVNQ